MEPREETGNLGTGGLIEGVETTDGIHEWMGRRAIATVVGPPDSDGGGVIRASSAASPAHRLGGGDPGPAVL